MHTEIDIFVFKICIETAFGRGSFAGEQEVIRWSEAIPHDITAVTLYGEADTIQYEVRNHEGKHSQNVFNLDVITARKRSLRRLCFHSCSSVHRGGLHPEGGLHPGSRKGLHLGGLHPGGWGSASRGRVLHPGGGFCIQ